MFVNLIRIIHRVSKASLGFSVSQGPYLKEPAFVQCLGRAIVPSVTILMDILLKNNTVFMRHPFISLPMPIRLILNALNECLLIEFLMNVIINF